MPFKSEKQRRWMWWKYPEMAKKWEKHTPKNKKLPEKAPKKKNKSSFDINIVKTASYKWAFAELTKREIKDIINDELEKMYKSNDFKTKIKEIINKEIDNFIKNTMPEELKRYQGNSELKRTINDVIRAYLLQYHKLNAGNEIITKDRIKDVFIPNRQLFHVMFEEIEKKLKED